MLASLRIHCRHGHEFTVENSYRNPAGILTCRTCSRAAAAKWVRKHYQRLMADPAFVARKREQGRLFKQRHPAQVREEQRLAYQRIRQEVLTVYGRRCAQCGFSDIRALQVDHVEGGGQRDHRAHGALSIYKRAIATFGSGAFQLLCANCNWIKVHEKEEYPWAW